VTPPELGTPEKPGRSGRLVLVSVIAASAVAALLVAVGFFVGLDRAYDSAVRAFESRVGSLDPADYEIPDVPDEENAAHWFVEAADALVLDEADRGILAVHAVAADETEVEDRAAALAAILGKNRKAIELAERGAACGRSKYGPMPDERISDQILLGHLLVGRARRAFAVGDESTELSTLRILGSLAAALCSELEEIRLLIGLEVASYQLSLIRAWLSRPDLDAPTCRSLSGLVLKQDLAAGFIRSLGFEGATSFQFYREALRRPNEKGGLPDPRIGARIYIRLVRHTAMTKVLRAMVDTSDTFGLSCPEMRRELDRRRRRLGPDWASNYSKMACQVKEGMARRQLILLALEVRRRASEGTPFSGIVPDLPGDANPLTGKSAQATLRADGSLVLSYRLAEEEWKRLCPSCDPQGRGLEVVLPPAGRGASGRSGLGRSPGRASQGSGERGGRS